MADSLRKKDPLLGAAVVKQVLRQSGGEAATSLLYQGLLRDLGLTDAQVETYLKANGAEVDAAIKSHGRR